MESGSGNKYRKSDPTCYNLVVKVIIRKAKASDLESILALNKKLFLHEEQFNHKYNLDWTYSDTGRNYFQGRLANKNSIIFIAEDNGVAVGYILCFTDSFPYRAINPICEIENMFIEESHRSKGVGSELVKKVKQEAKRQKVKLLRVGAIAQNERAINFYKTNGFMEVNLFLENEI